MAWGPRGSTGVQDIVQRLDRNDANLTSLHIFPTRKFGHQEVLELCHALGRNTVLEELYASGRHLTAESTTAVAEMLAKNGTLRSLCVGGDAFGDSGVSELVKGLRLNTTLQRLDLENKGISYAGAVSIADALLGRGQLLSLCLAHNPLTTKGVQALQPGIVSLKELDLRSCQIDHEAAEALAISLRDANCNLQVLHLDNNDLGSQGGAALAAGLWQCQSLRELHLGTTGIADEGVCAIAQALPHARSLTFLDLSSCSIGNDGASDLADAIADPFFSIHDKAALTEEFHGHAPTPAAVRVLKLRDTQITEQGVQELGEAIQQSSALQELDLAGSKVDARGLEALAGAQALQSLCLFNCQLGDAAAQQLLVSLQDGGFVQLRELDLSGNNIQELQMSQLLDVLQEPRTASALKVFIIGGNPGTQVKGFEDIVSKARQARSDLDIAWQASDPGQGSST